MPLGTEVDMAAGARGGSGTSLSIPFYKTLISELRKYITYSNKKMNITTEQTVA